jgi:hypothetical protein
MSKKIKSELDESIVIGLQNYTTEELKAEIKRRQRGERINRPRQKIEYTYASATIINMTNDTLIRRYYEVIIDEEDIRKYQISIYKKKFKVRVDMRLFKANNAPMIGDKVLIRSRRTKKAPMGFGIFGEVFISEITEHKNK